MVRRNVQFKKKTCQKISDIRKVMFQKTQFISILQLCLGMKYAAYFKLPMSFSTSLSCAFCNMSWSTIKKIKQKPNKYRESDTINKIRNEVSLLFLNSWYSTIEDTNIISINFNKFGKKVWESSTNIVILINLIKVLKWGNYVTLLFSRVCSQNFGFFSFDSYKYNLSEESHKLFFYKFAIYMYLSLVKQFLCMKL